MGEIHSGMPALQEAGWSCSESSLGWMNVLVHGDKWLKDVYQYFLRFVLAGSLRFGLYEVRKACL